MQKKGAIEFSMTTIIVVIIGVIILAIAIPWLTGTLRQAGELTDVAFDKAVESLRGNPTPDDPIMLSQDSFTLKRGERAALAVRFLNAEDSASFTLNFYEETTESQLFSLDETSKSIGSFFIKVLLRWYNHSVYLLLPLTLVITKSLPKQKTEHNYATVSGIS